MAKYILLQNNPQFNPTCVDFPGYNSILRQVVVQIINELSSFFRPTITNENVVFVHCGQFLCVPMCTSILTLMLALLNDGGNLT